MSEKLWKKKYQYSNPSTVWLSIVFNRSEINSFYISRYKWNNNPPFKFLFTKLSTSSSSTWGLFSFGPDKPLGHTDNPMGRTDNPMGRTDNPMGCTDDFAIPSLNWAWHGSTPSCFLNWKETSDWIRRLKTQEDTYHYEWKKLLVTAQCGVHMGNIPI